MASQRTTAVVTGGARDLPSARGSGRPDAGPSPKPPVVPHRKVRGREAPRARRHGRRLPGVRPRARARGRAQGDAPAGGGGPEHKQRFEREARAVARLSHPAVVTVFDLGYHTDGSPYIVMELLRGPDLLRAAEQEPALSSPRRRRSSPRCWTASATRTRRGSSTATSSPQRLPHRGRHCEDHGLRHRVRSSSGDEPVAVSALPATCPPSRCAARRGRPQRPLQRRHAALRAGHRAAAVRRRDADGDLLQDRQGRLHDRVPAARSTPGFCRSCSGTAEPRGALRDRSEFAAALRACGTSAVSRWCPATVATDAPAPDARGAAAAPEDAGPACRSEPSARAAARGLRGRQSGHLHLAVDGGRKSLRIRQGQIVHGTSDSAGEHMGDVLVRYGLLSQADLERAVAIVLRERRRLGEVLAELGLLERTASRRRSACTRARSCSTRSAVPGLLRLRGARGLARGDGHRLPLLDRGADPGGDAPDPRPRDGAEGAGRPGPRARALVRPAAAGPEDRAHARRTASCCPASTASSSARDVMALVPLPVRRRRAQPVQPAVHGHRRLSPGTTSASPAGTRDGRGGRGAGRERHATPSGPAHSSAPPTPPPVTPRPPSRPRPRRPRCRAAPRSAASRSYAR